jgi:uncharacterized protein (TIGR02271 family)
MHTHTSTTVVGVFDDRRHAQEAVRELKSAGFREEQIGVVSRDDRGNAMDTTAEHGSKAAEGAAIGAATGAGVGALWAVGIAAGLLPAIGPVIAGGLLASLLASAAGGAAVAGIAGALIGLGVPEEEAEYYEGEFKSGRTIVTVKAENRIDEAQRIVHAHGGHDMHSRTSPTSMGNTKPATVPMASAQACSTGASSMGAQGNIGKKVELKEEQIHPTKTTREAGEVRVRKDVITEHKSVEVPVTREEVVIERHPVAGGSATTSGIRPGEEIRIPVKEEEVHLEKRAVVKEEVNVGKRKFQDTQKVEADVRREELRVDQKGDVDVRGNTPRKP